ncbi:V-type ATP synthase subunit E family protein [Planobispora siamensis]|uniref:Uncharacterized protein n=1 Tax=Planobispora siamensis TaxID=936338 RepID=A0A8J3WQ17_9ACTN|nr:V-type ATP synthase subunit E family protein [Planobispora siamensis]GIH96317.1 hypothetical protein Psi01_69470 [Planobispora siamensis]
MSDRIGEALAPLTAALLRRTEREAEQTRERAGRQAAQTVAEAEEGARAVLADARARGEREADTEAAAERVATTRRVRTIELTARREILEDFRRRARTAVTGLREDPCYPALLKSLGRMARRRGGGDLVLAEHPEGGVVGEAPGRRVDASLPALAERAVDAAQGEAERSWLS